MSMILSLRLGLLSFTLAVLFSCSSLYKAGSSLGSGAGDALTTKAGSVGSGLGGGLVASARDSLLTEKTKQGLDSLLILLGQQLQIQVSQLRDSAIGEPSRLKLLKIETDLVKQIALARQQLLGESTRAQLGLIYSDLGDTAVNLVARLRDELLSEKTRLALDTMLSRVIENASQGIDKNLIPKLRSEQSFLKRNIKIIIWVAVAGIAVLMLLGWWLFHRGKQYRQTAEVMTLQIEKIEDENLKRELKKRIAFKASECRVEPMLRNILKGQGILGRKS